LNADNDVLITVIVKTLYMPGITPAVKVVIGDMNRFLVIRQVIDGKEFWDLPGGRIKYGEPPLDALHREVREEVDMELNIIGPIGTWWFFSEVDREHVICITYLAKPRGSRVNIDQDKSIAEARWVSQEEFLTDFFNVGHGSLKKLISDL